ncbi:MAG: penicillin-binding transpeptidase domain-containing protein, partial [Myxococcota bacterium]|nr:penicillin-binding transpeptidase domain-containing protein [Myxococcota bacterium]
SCDVNLRVCDWLPIERIPDTDPCVDARKDEKGRTMCRTCDLSMGLGSSSLTMVELARAYSVFATYGKFVEPHYINRVVDRDGTVIEEWTPPGDGWPEVMEPAVAGVAHWLLRNVATGGTAARTNRLGVQVAGKTGTTNDFFDAWFVGYDPEYITAAWVGYDQPRSIGVSFTGGQTALPIWMDFMKVAAPREAKRRFKEIPGVQWVAIDESTGRAAIGGLPMPMLPGTGPDNVAVEIGQKTTEDILTSDF